MGLRMRARLLAPTGNQNTHIQKNKRTQKPATTTNRWHWKHRRAAQKHKKTTRRKITQKRRQRQRASRRGQRRASGSPKSELVPAAQFFRSTHAGGVERRQQARHCARTPGRGASASSRRSSRAQRQSGERVQLKGRLFC